jgi:hypothetical protein
MGQHKDFTVNSAVYKIEEFELRIVLERGDEIEILLGSDDVPSTDLNAHTLK